MGIRSECSYLEQPGFGNLGLRYLPGREKAPNRHLQDRLDQTLSRIAAERVGLEAKSQPLLAQSSLYSRGSNHAEFPRAISTDMKTYCGPPSELLLGEDSLRH